MAIRSTTGCYTCKTRRKKCDEAHPRCQRCIKSGIECSGYEYINTKDGKLRTKPAPKPAPRIPPSAGQTPIPVCSLPTTSSVSTGQGQLRHLDTNDILRSSCTKSLASAPSAQSCETVVSAPLLLDTGWRAPQRALPITKPGPRALQPGPPMYNPIAGREAPSQSYLPAPVPLYGLERLNPDQASLFWALFSLGSTHSDMSPSDRIHSSSDLEASDESEDDDPEGVHQMWIKTPVLDCSVASNLLPLVLENYANWMMLIAFDPSRSVFSTKETLVRQLTSSERARSRIKLISETMNLIREGGPTNPNAIESVSVLVSGVHETVLAYNTRPPELIADLDQRNASKVLDNVLEILGLQIRSCPLSSSIALMECIAPIFRRACPEPPNTLVNLCDILLGPEMNLRHFATIDISFSVSIGRPMLFRYNVEFSIELCERMKSKDKNFGLQWLHGVPVQFIVLIAWMSRLKEDSEVGGHPVNEETVARIEGYIKDLKIFTTENESKDPVRHIERLVIQECWRQAVYVFLYMALCGATSHDPRVEKAHEAFVRLVNRVKPGRRPDVFLVIPWCTIGVATTRECDRDALRRRLYAPPECANLGTCGNDGIRMLDDIWKRTANEGRPAVWSDKRIACYRICGM